MQAAVTSAWEGLKAAAASLAHGVRQALLHMTPVGLIIQHWEAIKNTLASLPQALADLPARMLTLGGQIIDGLLAGIRQRGEALKEQVSSIASGIADTVRGAQLPEMYRAHITCDDVRRM